MSNTSRKPWLEISLGAFALAALAAGIAGAVIHQSKRDLAADWDARFEPRPDNGLVRELARPDSLPFPAPPPRPVATHAQEGDKMILNFENITPTISVSSTDIQEYQPGPITRPTPGDPIDFGNGNRLNLVAVVAYDTTVSSRPGKVQWIIDAQGAKMEITALKALGWSPDRGSTSHTPIQTLEFIFRRTGNPVIDKSTLMPKGDPAEGDDPVGGGFPIGSDLIRIASWRRRPDVSENALYLQVFGGRQSTATWTAESESDCVLDEDNTLPYLDGFEWHRGGGVGGYTSDPDARTCQYSFRKSPGRITKKIVTRIPVGQSAFRFWREGGMIKYTPPRAPLLANPDRLIFLEVDAGESLKITRLAESKRVILPLPPLPTQDYCTGPDPLDWPIPKTLRDRNPTLRETFGKMAFMLIEMPAEEMLRLDEFPECQTLRDVLREVMKEHHLKREHLVIFPKERQAYILPEPQPAWQRFVAWLKSTL